MEILPFELRAAQRWKRNSVGDGSVGLPMHPYSRLLTRGKSDKSDGGSSRTTSCPARMAPLLSVEITHGAARMGRAGNHACCCCPMEFLSTRQPSVSTAPARTRELHLLGRSSPVHGRLPCAFISTRPRLCRAWPP